MTLSGSSSSVLLPIVPAAAGGSLEAPMLIGNGAAIERLQLQIGRIGPHFRTVLVRGETGTGKELVARALHARSDRARGPFFICHAARLAEPEQHDGDLAQRLTEATGEGTLFLDGVEEASPEGQRGLLRILTQRTGLRMIASSSQDLRVMAAAGVFRQDIYHRLAMVEITLEPLRRRTGDIPALATHFLERFSTQYEKRIDTIGPDAMEKLLLHEWPGNVRELENVLHNGVLQCEGRVLAAADLPSLTDSVGTARPEERRQSEVPLRLQDVIDRHVLHVLQNCSGNKARAAEVLGISRSTLYRMLEGRSGQPI